MGASKSKMLVSELMAAREAESQMRDKLAERENCCEDLAAQLDTQKREYEKQYLDLESKHAALQERFLDLKLKFETEQLSSGDFANRATELSRKLNEALSERDIIKVEAQKQIEALLSHKKSFEDKIRELQQVESTYEEKIRCLEAERKVLLDETTEKDFEVTRLRDRAEELKSIYTLEKQRLEQEYNQKGHFLRSQFIEEKNQLNMQWEAKLNEVMKNCGTEVGQFKASIVQENSSLQDKLSTALNDINSLSRKYKLLNNLFEEIRTRYERRESRKEDLERIADLEGQLIVQSEEIERQRDMLKSFKYPSQAGQNNANTNSRRNRRNARKQRQLLSSIITGTENSYNANGKSGKRGRVSSSSSGSSSSSENKGDN